MRLALATNWGALVIRGLAGIILGLLALTWIRLRRYINHEWLLVLGGIASLVLGVLLMIAPLAGALLIAIWVGAYSLVFGVLLVALGLRLRSWGKTSTAGGQIPLHAH
jgi:uncharacterized membrane protein HdeD (DUF308 family)